MPESLSARELEVLGLVAAGHSNREVAAGLRVSRATVARRMEAILQKLDARNRAHAAAMTCPSEDCQPRSGPILGVLVQEAGVLLLVERGGGRWLS